jgi:hypothetical protein
MSNIDNIEIFTYIYKNKLWGDASNAMLVGSSGPGSSVEATNDTYTPFVRNFIESNQIKSVVDLGCGDWQSSYNIYKDMDIQYHGYDAYENVILNNQTMFPQFSFTFMDVVKDIDKIQSADLIIVKDVFQHLNYESVFFILDHIIKYKKAKYILTTNDSTTNDTYTDIDNGGYRPINWDALYAIKYVTESLLKYTIKDDSRLKEITLIHV